MPVITVAGLQFGSVIAFAIITETVFQWPGMGLLFIQAVQNVDIPIMAAYLLVVSLIFVTINLIVDILYTVVDPRLRATISVRPEREHGMTEALVPHDVEPDAASGSASGRVFGRIVGSDIFYSFRRSKLTMVAATITLLFFLLAIFASVLSVQNPFDPAQLQLMNSRISPLWTADGQSPFLLGTDEQGRDVFSAILYGLRISLTVGVFGVLVAGTFGIILGLIAGYVGGAVDGLIMRIADVQLTFPAILIALLINGVVKSVMGNRLDAMSTLAVLVFAIGLSFWVQYARTVRGSVMVEKNKDYVAAAQLIGLPAPVIMLRHVLPNAMGPILVIATINLALAIITEATLSFLGAGMPDTMPSLGTLIRIGNNYLFAGEWWIVAFPGIALAGLILSINLLGDWLRDALNPKLR